MKTKKLVQTAFFTAVTAVCAQLAVFLPFSPVPFTFSLFAVFLTGALLEKKQAFYAQLAYLLLGAFGIPVFAGFKGGAACIVGPTGGYLAAYPVMALLIAAILEKHGGKRFLLKISGMTAALFLCYLLGTAWLIFSTGMGWRQGFLAGAAPFMLPDVIKIVLSASLSVPLEKAAQKARFQESFPGK